MADRSTEVYQICEDSLIADHMAHKDLGNTFDERGPASAPDAHMMQRHDDHADPREYASTSPIPQWANTSDR